MPSNRSGFTIIEILVAITIVVVLVFLAAPNYRLYLAKAKQNEARSALAQILQAEKTFFAEHKSYTYCLHQAGYQPSAASDRYYLTGFFNEGGDGCGVGSCWFTNFERKEACSAGTRPWGTGGSRNDATFSMNRWANSALKGAGITGVYSVSGEKFNAVAFGSINEGSRLFDVWQIDEAGLITNPQSGL